METPNPYQKPAPMTKAQSDLIEKENELRHQFAEKRNSLSDPHILLHNVFNSSLSFDYQLEDEDEVFFGDIRFGLHAENCAEVADPPPSPGPERIVDRLEAAVSATL
jgi:hypothetical protein